jgi:hypothetical protein
MSRRVVHLERLLGRKVHDPAGKFAGRIEEIVAETKAGDCCEIREYLLGRGGFLARMSIAVVSSSLIRLLGARNNTPTRRVPWDQMDLSDPSHPRLKCPAEELPKV